MRQPLLALALLWTANSAIAQDPAPLFRDHEPPLADHFGSAHPDAPAALAEFHFLVGRFDCRDNYLRPDGSRGESHGTWTARYVLNGQAIQDSYWNVGYAGTSIRWYDEAAGQWHVVFYGGPPFFRGEWTGGRQPNGDMQLTQERPQPDGPPIISRLTFSEIEDDGFHWISERVIDGEVTAVTWEIDCTRTAAP